MKKIIPLLLCISLLFSGCSNAKKPVSIKALTEQYQKNGTIPKESVVFKDFSLQSGEEDWKKFIVDCSHNKHASILLVNQYTDDADTSSDNSIVSFSLLSYNGKEYTIETYEDGKETSKTYPYLIHFQGEPSSASAVFSEYDYYVLVHDESYTWNQLEHSMFSSNLDDQIDFTPVYMNHLT